jgi:hypothetical protein
MGGTMHDKQVQLRLRKKKPLALWLAAISAQATIAALAPAAASDLPVVLTATTSCDDDGSPGTLRYAVLTASDGDTIDLSALTCSHITLQTGAINVDQNSLTMVGAGAAELSIDANHAGRAFFHSGSGTLSLDEMTVSDGLYTAPRAMGGCIYSKGSVALNHMIVSGCEARGTTAASGGGVLATYDLSLVRSTLSGNIAHATVGAVGTAAAAGGGAAALHHLTLLYSLVSGNSAHAAAGTVHGGGLYVVKSFNGKYSTINANTATVDYFLINGSSALAGGLSFGYNGHATSFLMQSCTIDHNRADAAAGLILDGDTTDTSSIRNSTISTNIANFEGGGVAVATRLTLSNSTIAFNSTGVYGGGGMIAVGDKMTLGEFHHRRKQSKRHCIRRGS